MIAQTAQDFSAVTCVLCWVVQLRKTRGCVHSAWKVPVAVQHQSSRRGIFLHVYTNSHTELERAQRCAMPDKQQSSQLAVRRATAATLDLSALTSAEDAMQDAVYRDGGHVMGSTGRFLACTVEAGSVGGIQHVPEGARKCSVSGSRAVFQERRSKGCIQSRGTSMKRANWRRCQCSYERRPLSSSSRPLSLTDIGDRTSGEKHRNIFDKKKARQMSFLTDNCKLSWRVAVSVSKGTQAGT